MSRTSKKRSDPTGTVIGWIGAAIGLLAACILDTKEQPQKWHAAIMWTVFTFGGAMSIYHHKWMSRSFWVLWTICLTIHVFVMWLIFGKIFWFVQSIGTFYMVPLAIVELMFLHMMMKNIGRRFERLVQTKYE